MKSSLKILFALSTLLTFVATAQEEIDLSSLNGSWSGELVIGRDSLDMTFNITVEAGNYNAAFISRKMGIYGMPAESMEINNNRIRIRMELLAAEYTGRIRMDDSGNVIAFIDGEWFQEGEMVPVILRQPEP